MKRRTLIASIGAVAGTTLGAAAYSSATVNRDATISIAADDSALVTLEAGSFGQISKNDQTGALEINFSSLNGNSTFTFGDTANATSTYAFSLTNADTVPHDISLAYELDATDDPAPDTPNVTFDIYDNSGAQDSTVDETTTDHNIAGMPIDTPYYVVLHIDTTGLDTSADLSGELSISGSTDTSTSST